MGPKELFEMVADAHVLVGKVTAAVEVGKFEAKDFLTELLDLGVVLFFAEPLTSTMFKSRMFVFFSK